MKAAGIHTGRTIGQAGLDRMKEGFPDSSNPEGARRFRLLKNILSDFWKRKNAV